MRRQQAIVFLYALASICVVATVNADVNASSSVDSNDQKNDYHKPDFSLVSQTTSNQPAITQSWSPSHEADSTSKANFNSITKTLRTVSQCTATVSADCPSPMCGSSETLCPSEIDIKITPECHPTDTITITKTSALIMSDVRCTVTSPCKDSPQDGDRALNYEIQQDVMKPHEHTTARFPEFDCRIIPTTETLTFSKTRAGPVETIFTYETLTKTPTVTNTLYTSCMPDCVSVVASDVVETTTTALFTEYEVTMQCNSPPTIYTDTLTLYSTQVLPVRNVDTVTITVTPEEPATSFTSTYYIGTYADKVVEDVYLDCVLPPPCEGFEAATVTETATIETTTLTETLCLDNWSFYQVTSTTTEYSCFNPFSVYACPDGGVCPLPITMTETLEVADVTVTLTDKVAQPCIWGSPSMTGYPTIEYLTPENPPPNGNQGQGYTVLVSVGLGCSAGAPSAISSEQLAQLIVENNQIFREVEQLLQDLTLNVNNWFPNNRMKSGAHAKLLDRLTKAKYDEGWKNLRRSDFMLLVSRHKQMILSLSRYAKDAERITANPKLFFDQLEVLVKSLEKPLDYRGIK